MYSYFLIFLVHAGSFECPSLVCGSQKERNDRVEWKGFWSLNILEFTSVREGAHNSGGRYNKRLPPLFLYLCDQKEQSAIRAQTPDVCGQGPFTTPGSCKLCASCFRNVRTAACHVAGEGAWVTATVLSTEID